jgi:dipeptidyl aminopeptidase/acylaminoacyl peptidase
LYPPTDLEYAYAHPTNPAVLDSRGILEAYLGGPPQLRAPLYRDASPLYRVDDLTPPTLLIHGERDELVFAEHSIRLGEALRAHRRPHAVVLLPWATHGCDAHMTGPCGQLTLYAIERFLREVLAP